MTSKKAPTPTDVSRSLTGFDELAIKQKFGMPIVRLGQEDPTQFLRALAFVLARRDEKSDAEAYSLTQTMPFSEVSDKFSPEPKDKDESAEADFVTQPNMTTP